MKKISILFMCIIFNNQAQESTVNAKQCIQNYMQKLTILQAKFMQINKNNSTSTGVLLIKKTHNDTKLKMFYDDPEKNVLILRDGKIIHYDRALKEKTIASVQASPIAFLIYNYDGANKQIKVLSAQMTDNNYVIKVAKPDTQGAVQLIFSKDGTQLKGWVIFEDENSENNPTSIHLIDQKIPEELDSKRFSQYEQV